jgi:hypothetical protein
MALAVVRDKARKRGIPKKSTGCPVEDRTGLRQPASGTRRYRRFSILAMIEKQKGKAKDPLLLSTLNSPAKDYFSILVMKLIVSNC